MTHSQAKRVFFRNDVLIVKSHIKVRIGGTPYVKTHTRMTSSGSRLGGQMFDPFRVFLGADLLYVTSCSFGANTSAFGALEGAKTPFPALIPINRSQPFRVWCSSCSQNSIPGPDSDHPEETLPRLVLFMFPELHSRV